MVLPGLTVIFADRAGQPMAEQTVHHLPLRRLVPDHQQVARLWNPLEPGQREIAGQLGRLGGRPCFAAVLGNALKDSPEVDSPEHQQTPVT